MQPTIWEAAQHISKRFEKEWGKLCVVGRRQGNAKPHVEVHVRKERIEVWAMTLQGVTPLFLKLENQLTAWGHSLYTIRRYERGK